MIRTLLAAIIVATTLTIGTASAQPAPVACPTSSLHRIVVARHSQGVIRIDCRVSAGTGRFFL